MDVLTLLFLWMLESAHASSGGVAGRAPPSAAVARRGLFEDALLFLHCRLSLSAVTIASTSAVYNAVIDALQPFDVKSLRMPMTPERVWRAINGA